IFDLKTSAFLEHPGVLPADRLGGQNDVVLPIASDPDLALVEVVLASLALLFDLRCLHEVNRRADPFLDQSRKNLDDEQLPFFSAGKESMKPVVQRGFLASIRGQARELE